MPTTARPAPRKAASRPALTADIGGATGTFGGAAGAIGHHSSEDLSLRSRDNLAAIGVLAGQTLAHVARASYCGRREPPGRRVGHRLRWKIIAKSTALGHTTAQPCGVAGLSSGTSSPGWDRDTELMEFDSQVNRLPNSSPRSRNG